MEKTNRLLQSLQTHFERVYVLTLSNRKDRQTLIEKQLEILGLPKPDETPFIRWFYATPFPFNNLIADAFNKSGKGCFTKPNEYDCARNHYNIVRISSDTLDDDAHIMIIEDDVLFMKDADKFADYINALPEDYDIVQFGGFTADPNIHKYIQSEEKWVKHKHVGVWNTSGYALSKRGMGFYMAFMDNVLFWVADGPLYKAPLSDSLINTYLSSQPLVVQALNNQVASDIRNSNNDKIDYETQNEYEKSVSRDDFFSAI